MHGIAALHIGDLTVVREHFESALALTQSGDTSFSQKSFLSRNTSCHAWALWSGILAPSATEVELRRWLKSSSLGRAGSTTPTVRPSRLLFGALLGSMSRDASLTLERSEELVAVARERGFRLHQSVGEIYLGWATAQAGEVESGASQLVAGLAAFEATGARMLAALNYSLLAEAHRQAGRPQEALAATEVGLDRAESTGSASLKPSSTASEANSYCTAPPEMWERRKPVFAEPWRCRVRRERGRSSCAPGRASSSWQLVAVDRDILPATFSSFFLAPYYLPPSPPRCN